LVIARLTWVFAVAWLMVRVGVAQAVGDESDDLLLASGELVQGVRIQPWGCGSFGEPGDQPAGQSRRQERFAARDEPDTVQQLAGFGVLDQEARGHRRPGPR